VKQKKCVGKKTGLVLLFDCYQNHFEGKKEKKRENTKKTKSSFLFFLGFGVSKKEQFLVFFRTRKIEAKETAKNPSENFHHSRKRLFKAEHELTS
jgi:hypothetical protein